MIILYKRNKILTNCCCCCCIYLSVALSSLWFWQLIFILVVLYLFVCTLFIFTNLDRVVKTRTRSIFTTKKKITCNLVEEFLPLSSFNFIQMCSRRIDNQCFDHFNSLKSKIFFQMNVSHEILPNEWNLIIEYNNKLRHRNNNKILMMMIMMMKLICRNQNDDYYYYFIVDDSIV